MSAVVTFTTTAFDMTKLAFLQLLAVATADTIGTATATTSCGYSFAYLTAHTEAFYN